MAYPPHKHAAATAAAPDVRLDARQCGIVEDGIAVQAGSNTMTAVEYLRTRNIDSHVIERVLLEPHRRRTRS